MSGSGGGVRVDGDRLAAAQHVSLLPHGAVDGHGSRVDQLLRRGARAHPRVGAQGDVEAFAAHGLDGERVGHELSLPSSASRAASAT